MCHVACAIMILLLLSLRLLACILFNILKLEKCFDLLYYATMTLRYPSTFHPVVCLSYHNYRRASKRKCLRFNPLVTKDQGTEETAIEKMHKEMQPSIECEAL